MVSAHSSGWLRSPEVGLLMGDDGEILVARSGRNKQRYENGYRLVAGCIPYRIRQPGDTIPPSGPEAELEVLMITSQHGQGLLFPKGGWETDETAEEAACREAVEEAGVRGLVEAHVGTFEFRSKRLRTELCKDGACRAHVYALAVTEQLDVWPEQNRRSRFWLTRREAIERCRHDWMRTALEQWASGASPDQTLAGSSSGSSPTSSRLSNP